MDNKKSKPITLDQLARMVAEGFHDIGERFDKRFSGIESRLDSVESRLNSVESRLDSVESHLNRLETGQEDIKLLLDNVPHRFELVELSRRLDVLEKHAGISRKR